MTKKQIDAFDYAKEITQATKKGILVNTMADGRFNTMTVSWGSLGTEWNRPIFTVYIRNSRFTHAQLEKTPEFTISIPMGEYDKKIIGKAGVQTDGKRISSRNIVWNWLSQSRSLYQAFVSFR